MSNKTLESSALVKNYVKKEENPDDCFVWQDYLDATNSKEVPQILFSHVEESLQSGFQEGMAVEIPLKEDSNNYWVATIITACGPLLSLRYFGDKDDRSKDFWCDTGKCELRPLGWMESHERVLVPPPHLSAVISHIDLKTKLKGARTIRSSDITNCDGFSPVERIKEGMKVEVQDSLHPYHVWPATIIENIGGRLLLRYDTPDLSSDKDFWLFYSSPRVFPLGWTKKKGNPWKLVRPSCFRKSQCSYKKWDAILDSLKESDPLTSDVFENTNSEEIPLHKLIEGMKLEMVHPESRAEICPGTVTKVFDDKYFLVRCDKATQSDKKSFDDKGGGDSDDQYNLTRLATLLDPFILPVGWTKAYNLKLSHPCGWMSTKEEFEWVDYLDETKSKVAPIEKTYANNIAVESGFELGMKLEVVNPENEHEICAATIANVCEHLLWIHLDSTDCFQPSVIFNMDSMDIFPINWCDMNNYTLQPPLSFQTLSQTSSRSSETVKSEQENLKGEDSDEKSKDSSKNLESSKVLEKAQSKSSFWCPKIYFNHKCFSGPFLSKGKLAQLPKAVGPGPVTLVMKEVLSMLISVAYISSRVLRELQCKNKPRPGMHLEVLKAKYKMNAYRANVEIVTSADKVAEFCKEVCQKLQVCPHLFGPVAVGEKSCPENCSTLSKTRFCKKAAVSNNNSNDSSNGSNLIKKAIAPDIDSSTSQATRGIERLFTWPRKKRGLQKDYLSEYGKENEDNSSGKRVRYETRGVKLPNFGLKKSNGQSSNNGNGVSNAQIIKPHHLLSHSPTGSECSSISSNVNDYPSRQTTPTPSAPQTPKKKRGRHSKARKEELRKEAELISDSKMDDSLYQVDTNPLLWTVEDVYDYLRSTDDCDVLANLLKEEEFDGKSFMLLNLPSCLESLKLNLKTALSLCRHVEAVKFTFFCKYVIPTSPGYQIDDQCTTSSN